jgi:cobalt/nickel transport system ATP-binding protein
MDCLIDVENLRFRYDDGTPILKGIDFRLEAGESVAILGANGSGKTTFVMHLNGLLTGEGRIEVCGLAMEKRNLPAIRRKIGLVLQDAESQLFMPTVLEDVAFGPLNLGMNPAEAADQARAALDMVGMAAAAAKAPYHLSAGEKRRVAIAGVLAMNPAVLIFDEPTTSLDPPGQMALAALLARLPQAKIIVTHAVAFAQYLCTRAIFFREGAIVAEGSVEDIAARFGWETTWERTKSGA